MYLGFVFVCYFGLAAATDLLFPLVAYKGYRANDYEMSDASCSYQMLLVTLTMFTFSRCLIFLLFVFGLDNTNEIKYTKIG